MSKNNENNAPSHEEMQELVRLTDVSKDVVPEYDGESRLMIPAFIRSEYKERVIAIINSSGTEDRNAAANMEHFSSLKVPFHLYDNVSDAIREKEMRKRKLETLDAKTVSKNEHITRGTNKAALKAEAVRSIETLARETGGKPLFFVVDSCFTNDALISYFRELLGDDRFNELAVIRTIDWENPKTLHFAPPDNAIIFIGGSFSDTYAVNGGVYDSEFAKYAKRTMDSCWNGQDNRRLIGICFGHQFLATLTGLARTEEGSVVNLTVKSQAKFGILPTVVEKDIPHQYARMLEELTSGGRVDSFSGVHTQTGEVHVNLLDSNVDSSEAVVLAKGVTGAPNMLGTVNGKVITIQPHPEIAFETPEQISKVRAKFKELAPLIVKSYPGSEKIVENVGSGYESDIDDAFFLPVVSQFAKSIERDWRDKQTNKIQKERSKEASKKEFSECANIGVFQRMKEDDAKDFVMFANTASDALRNLDVTGTMVLNSKLDWKVNRGEGEYMKECGLKIGSSGRIMELVKRTSGRKFLRVCDWGAGNGRFLSDLEKLDDTIFDFGFGDAFYMDVAEMLEINETVKKAKIPEDIMELASQKLILSMREMTGTVKERFVKAVDALRIRADGKIILSGVYEGEFGDRPLKHSSVEWIYSNQGKVEAVIKGLASGDFYSEIGRTGSNIFIDDFRSIKDRNGLFKSDLSFAVRSTSHLGCSDYKGFLVNYMERFSEPGSLMFENGVHQSYTKIARIPEYAAALDIIAEKKIREISIRRKEIIEIASAFGKSVSEDISTSINDEKKYGNASCDARLASIQMSYIQKATDLMKAGRISQDAVRKIADIVFAGTFRFDFVFDRKRNVVRSAILRKYPFVKRNDVAELVSPDYELVSLGSLVASDEYVFEERARRHIRNLFFKERGIFDLEHIAIEKFLSKSINTLRMVGRDGEAEIAKDYMNLINSISETYNVRNKDNAYSKIQEVSFPEMARYVLFPKK